MIQPLTDRVLIKPKQPEERTAAGIYIPETAQEKTQEGEIVAVGTDKDGKALPVKVGDHVLFESFGGTEFRVKDEKLLIMNIKDVLAILR